MSEVNGTLCWTCQRATNRPGMGCSWAKRKHPRPVDGWTATRRDVYQQGHGSGHVESYIVHACPLYLADPPREGDTAKGEAPAAAREVRRYDYRGKLYTVSELAKLAGIKPRTLASRLKRGATVVEAVEIPIKEIAAPQTVCVGGQPKTIRQLVYEYGIPETTLRTRIARGWSVEDILANPQGLHGPVPVHMLTINGRTMSISAWARETGIKAKTIRYRYKTGQRGEALIAPVKTERGGQDNG